MGVKVKGSMEIRKQIEAVRRCDLV